MRAAGVEDGVVVADAPTGGVDVGAMPICGEDNRLKGVLSDRDLVEAISAAP